MNGEQNIQHGDLTWLAIFFAGLILFIVAFYGAFTVYPPFSPANSRPVICLGFNRYDYLAGIVDLLLVIIGFKIRPELITRN